MKNTPLYQNLDTTFVNFDALVRYLRRRRFTGELRVGSNAYDATIVFTDEGKLRVTEHDKIADALMHGEKAFDRIINRTKEPGINIDVVHRTKAMPELGLKSDVSKALPIENDPPRLGLKRNGNGTNGILRAEPMDMSMFGRESKTVAEPAVVNGHRERTAVELISELLETIDAALQRAKLDLAAAFAKASGELAGEFPFLDPASGKIDYSAGRFKVEPDLDDGLLVEGVGEVLVRIFSRLGSNPRTGKVYRFTQQRVRAFRRDMLAHGDDHGVTELIERLLAD